MAIGTGQPQLEVGIGADLTPFEKAIGELQAEIGQLSTAITQSGKSASKDYTTHIDKAGQTTDSFTGFIKKQRQENRLQNFVFRESQGAIAAVTFSMLALTSATGDDSKATQQLNRVLASSFSAFQGVSFGMQALGVASGGVVTGISTIVAIGVGLLSFLRNAKTDLAALTRETQLASKEWEVYNSLLERRAKNLDVLSAKRLTSELNVGLYFIEKIEARLDEVNVLLVTAEDEQKKMLEAEKSRLEKRREVQWSLVQAVITEQNARKGLIPDLERQITLLEQEKKKAENLGQIYWVNAQIEHKKLELALANRGTSLEFESKYVAYLQEENRLQQIASKIQLTKKPILEKVQLIKVDEVGPGLQVALAILDEAEQKELQFLGLLSQNFSILQQGLHNIGGEASSTLAKMITIAQYAVQIADIISAINAGKMGAGMGGLGILGSILSIVGIAFLQGGGLAFGPTLAVVGDNPNASINPEVIAPLSELRGMGMQRVHVTGTFKISGHDLLLVIDDAEDKRGRIRGD